jgi:hypothetical protein
VQFGRRCAMKSMLAEWKPAGYTGLSSRQPQAAAVIHTNGGHTPGGSLFAYFSGLAKLPPSADLYHVGAHFQVAKSGAIEQYVDTDLAIGHAWDASRFAVGIETEDDGDPSTPWTAAQTRSIVALLAELKIPGKLLLEAASDGVGWHQFYPSWNKSAHNCPGPVRVAQIRDVIIPWLKGGFLMALTDDQQKTIADQLDRNDRWQDGVKQAFGLETVGTPGGTPPANADKHAGYKMAMLLQRLAEKLGVDYSDL